MTGIFQKVRSYWATEYMQVNTLLEPFAKLMQSDLIRT